jgi:hypothetical protein
MISCIMPIVPAALRIYIMDEVGSGEGCVVVLHQQLPVFIMNHSLLPASIIIGASYYNFEILTAV